MRYIGGKANWPGLPRLITRLIPRGGSYLEPFCGACTVLHRVKASRRFGGDTNPHIVALMRAVRDGWDPPSSVSEEDFQWAKKVIKSRHGDRLAAFYAFGCAFAGDGHSGMARCSKGLNYAAQSRRSLLRQRPGLRGVVLQPFDYREWKNLSRYSVLYCDPPYDGTAPVGVPGGEKFNSDDFWDWADRAARATTVLVSEYACPVRESVCVWERTTTKGTRFKDGRNKTEKLFLLGRSGVGLFS